MAPRSRPRALCAKRRTRACAVKGAYFQRVRIPPGNPATVAPAGSNRSGCGGNEAVEAFGAKVRLWTISERAGRNASERWASPENHFYPLDDKVYRKDALAFAYACSRANGGSAGMDGQTFEDIEAYRRQKWLGELADELKEKRYVPQAVRAVLEPIFETDLQPEQHAYRAVDAHTRKRLRPWLCRKHGEPCRRWSHYPAQHLYVELGLLYLPSRADNFSWG